MTSNYTIAGVMSGTSLDGLDITICQFEDLSGRWVFDVAAAITIPYSDEWRTRLINAFNSSGESLAQLHADFGIYIGQCVKKFCDDNHLKPHYISSHGHTIFHQPANKFTFQLGSGAHIAVVSGIDTICDFRSTDVALGGQGAPLVPIGDQFLFGGHKFCLNLGGFANISFDDNNSRIAFDICPVNVALNYLSLKNQRPFDKNGDMANSGIIIPEMLNQMNQLNYYREKRPKSLAREWFDHQFLPIIQNDDFSVNDRLRTVVEHIGTQIADALFFSPGTTMLTTGGGAYNNLLIEVIGEYISRHGIHAVVPDETIVEFKEAIVFAFLGLLRINGNANSLSSVTGASRDSIGGALYTGK